MRAGVAAWRGSLRALLVLAPGAAALERDDDLGHGAASAVGCVLGGGAGGGAGREACRSRGRRRPGRGGRAAPAARLAALRTEGEHVAKLLDAFDEVWDALVPEERREVGGMG